MKSRNPPPNAWADRSQELGLLRATLEALEEAIIAFDGDGGIVYYNSKFAQLWNISPPGMEKVSEEGEILTFISQQLMDPAHFLSAIAPSQSYSDGAISGTLRTGDDRHIVFHSHDRMQGSQRTGRIWSFYDITETVHAKKEVELLMQDLERSNADLEQFAYVASHDLQEPLRAVTGSVQLLARRYKGELDHEADEFIEFAVDGARRMKTLIVDLLTYSRVTTRGSPFTVVDCESVLEIALANLSAAINEACASVTHDPLPAVWGDSARLALVFQNLISNAIKFRGAKTPKVHISAQRENGSEWWQFAIRDNGIGFDQRYADRIFVIFQRLHTTDEYPGSGMGLTLCKRIIDRHGGRIWVNSTLSEGSVFYFTLPSVDAPVPQTALAHPGQTGK